MKQISIVLCLLLFMSCGNIQQDSEALKLSSVDKNDSLFVVDLDTVHETTVLNMSSLFSKAEYIALETTEASLLGHISQIAIKGDTLFILDGSVTKQVQLFLKNGKYIGTLGNRGNGPYEYLSPTCIGVDGSNVYIYDVTKKEILFYDNLTLKYKEKMKIDPAVINRYVSVIDGQIYSDAYSYTGINPYLIQTIDNTNHQSKDKWLSPQDYSLNFQDPFYFTGDVCFYRTGDGIRYYNMFGDTIMNLTKNSVQPYCAIKSKDFIRQEELSRLIESKGNSIRNFRDNIKGLYNIRHYVECNRYIMFRLSHSNFMKVILLNKHTRSFNVTSQLFDDFTFKDRKKGLTPTPIVGDGDGFYAYIAPIDMEYLFRLFQEKNVTDNFKEFVDSNKLKEDSNPILIYYE